MRWRFFLGIWYITSYQHDQGTRLHRDFEIMSIFRGRVDMWAQLTKLYLVFCNRTEAEFIFRWRDCLIPASLSYSELVDIRKDIWSPKTCSNIPRDGQLPNGVTLDGNFLKWKRHYDSMTKQEIAKCKCRWRLVVYLMLLASSHPYPWLILYLKKWCNM